MLLKDMVFDERYPNMRVDPDWFEGKHPQEFLPKVEDPIALYRPAVEVVLGPTAPLLDVALAGVQATLTWSPSETDISEILSYTIMRSTDGNPFTTLVVCKVLRDFLGGIIGVDNCTTASSIPHNDSGHSGSVYDKVTTEDAPITYVDATLAGGHTYCYLVFATPMGNNQSVGQGPPSTNSNTVCVTSGGGTGLVWQHRTNFGSPVTAVGAHAGTALAIDSNLAVHKSTDGGRTWSQIATLDISLSGAGGNLIFNNGAWLFAAGGAIARSTDNGATWTAIDTGATSAGFGVVAGNGANLLVLITNVLSAPFPQVNYARSTDNGLTWTASDVLVGATLYPTPPVWDGSQFVGIKQAPITGLTSVATSPDGLTWTFIPITTPAGLSALQLSAGVYTSSTFTTVDCIVTGTTPANLATATPVPVSSDINGLNAILSAAGLFFAFDGVGGVDNSTDAVNWFVGTLNLTGGDAVNGPTCVAYDAVNSSYIAAGAAGNVSTYPPGGGGGPITSNFTITNGVVNCAQSAIGNDAACHGFVPITGFAGHTDFTQVSGGALVSGDAANLVYAAGISAAGTNGFFFALRGTWTAADITSLSYLGNDAVTHTLVPTGAGFLLGTATDAGNPALTYTYFNWFQAQYPGFSSMQTGQNVTFTLVSPTITL